MSYVPDYEFESVEPDFIEHGAEMQEHEQHESFICSIIEFRKRKFETNYEFPAILKESKG